MSLNTFGQISGLILGKFENIWSNMFFIRLSNYSIGVSRVTCTSYIHLQRLYLPFIEVLFNILCEYHVTNSVDALVYITNDNYDGNIDLENIKWSAIR